MAKLSAVAIENWRVIEGLEAVPSPALLVIEEQVRQNIATAVDLAGGADRLRPHVKTHKMEEVVGLQMDAGITRFKCATPAEVAMVARCGGRDVLLANQPVGPNAGRLLELTRRFPDTTFATVLDDPGAARALAKIFAEANAEIGIFLDLDCGMQRTGIAPGQGALALYREIAGLRGLRAEGLHVYDGHVREAGRSQREVHFSEAMAPVSELLGALSEEGLPVHSLVGGGSPTFAQHAGRAWPGLRAECSPGTFVFWDAGYSESFPDLDFQPAAFVLSRVVSKPGVDLLCLDLGNKAVASENPPARRVRFPDLPDAEVRVHSEEHLVLEVENASAFAVGDLVCGVPWHICPTVALYEEATVVRGSQVAESWKVAARGR
ncbi:MAG: D-TA family PLP-dependent enzyme, partial [Verrucomicrobiales bacterium]